MITRGGLHQENSRLDEIIDAANKQKAANFKAYREQLEKAGSKKTAVKVEIEAFKKAERKIKTFKKNKEAALEQETLVDEIVLEIERFKDVGTNNATRVRVARDNSAEVAGASRDDKRDVAAPRSPTKRPSAQGKSGTSKTPAPASSAEMKSSPATGEPVSEYQEPSSDSSAPQPLDDRSDAAGSPVASDELIPAFLRRDPDAAVWRT